MREGNAFFARRDGWYGTSTYKRLGVAMIVIGCVGFLVSAVGLMSMLGLGVFNLIAMNWLESNPLIKLNNDHMEMKAAIAAPRKLVLYTDIARLVEKSAKHVVLETKQGDKIRLPVHALEDTVRNELVTELRKRAKA